jgi:16S rRNA (guanine966-N2)-methyltransferase
VVLVERSESVARALRESVRTLRAAQVSVVRADARRWLDGHGEPFDLVFLDPPFDADLLARCCELLAANGWLAPGALIYLEADASKGFPDLPDRWRLVREKRAGRVCFGLAAAGDGYRIVD